MSDTQSVESADPQSLHADTTIQDEPAPSLILPGDPRADQQSPTPRNQRWRVPLWLDILAGWVWRVGLISIGIYALLLAFGILRLVTVPLLFALVFAALLWPLRERLVGWGLSESASATLLVSLSFLAIGGVVWLAAVGVFDQLANNTNWQLTEARVDRWLMEGPLGLDRVEVEQLELRVRNSLARGMTRVDVGRARFAVELASSVVLTVILVFFFMKDGSRMMDAVSKRVHPRRRETIQRAGASAFQALGGYARSVAIAGVIDSILIGGVLLILGVPLAIPLAILTFFASFLPIIGASSIGALSVLVAFATVGPREALLVAAATLLIQQLEGNVILPHVMGSRIGLHPVVVLLVLSVGGLLAGVVGALVAVPLAAMASAAASEFRDHTVSAPLRATRD